MNLVRHSTCIAAFGITLGVLLAASGAGLRADMGSAFQAPSHPPPPPSMTKLADSLVIAVLPDGRLIGVFDRTGPAGPEAALRYSSDGGRTWSDRGTGFDAFAHMGRFSSGVLYSDDGGDTWEQADFEFKVPSPIIGAVPSHPRTRSRGG